MANTHLDLKKNTLEQTAQTVKTKTEKKSTGRLP